MLDRDGGRGAANRLAALPADSMPRPNGCARSWETPYLSSSIRACVESCESWSDVDVSRPVRTWRKPVRDACEQADTGEHDQDADRLLARAPDDQADAEDDRDDRAARQGEKAGDRARDQARRLEREHAEPFSPSSLCTIR